MNSIRQPFNMRGALPTDVHWYHCLPPPPRPLLPLPPDWQLRLLLLSAGLEVLSMKCVRIGGLRIPQSLPLGGCR